MALANDTYVEIKDLSRGINTFDTDTAVPEGYYVDAQNMLLTAKSPITIGGLTKFNTTAAPNGRRIRWFEPFTTSTGATVIIAALTDASHADGAGIWKYDPAGDTWTPLWLQMDPVAEIYSHVPFRGQLIFTNDSGSDSAGPVIEDDQVLKYDGTNVMPVGAMWGDQLVADMESDETWSGGTAESGAGNRKEGSQSRSLGSITSMSITYGTAKNFVTGILGAPDFTTTDKFWIWYKKPASSTITFRVRFGDVGDANYFEASYTSLSTPSTADWARASKLRSDFATTGSPNWNNIAKFTIFLDTGSVTVYFDAPHWAYGLSPPFASLVEMYSQQLVLGRIGTDRTAIRYSDPGSPDYFPTVNTARFSGGRHSLERTDQITALWAYFDELIVGKVNSAWTFSGTGTNTSISALPLTIGIDAHRAIVETPWSLNYVFENNIFGARLTSRGLISTHISSLLSTLNSGEFANRTISIRHDRTHTVRWSFRTINASPSTENDLGLIYDYQLDAWASRYTPHVAYYTRATINNQRELLCCQYDGYIRRVDVGTTFDGADIVSYVTLPWKQAQDLDHKANVCKWRHAVVYTRGSGTVIVEARFADEPHEMDGATFATYGSLATTPDGDKGFVPLEVTARWCQLRLRSIGGSFQVLPPVLIGYNPTERRI